MMSEPNTDPIPAPRFFYDFFFGWKKKTKKINFLMKRKLLFIHSFIFWFSHYFTENHSNVNKTKLKKRTTLKMPSLNKRDPLLRLVQIPELHTRIIVASNLDFLNNLLWESQILFRFQHLRFCNFDFRFWRKKRMEFSLG